MIQWAIVDTGPLVALLDRAEHYHEWAAKQVKQLDPPMLVCEPVLVEAMFLLNRNPAAQDAILSSLENGSLQIAFHLDEHLPEIRALLKKYRDRPMSLADACLVRMAELFNRYHIFTLDSDFKVYRRHGRDPLKLIYPE
ncbi:MAG: PIN domain-containing protein [Deltaproteobacteria bacterium]|nr:PIN domain-containing protein [Deltaproteobacteria bacterium]